MKADTAQRIAEALARTGEPRAPAEGLNNDEGHSVVGTVPMHLRHLNNLLEDLDAEVKIAEAVLHTRVQRKKQVKTLFYDSLKTSTPLPESTNAMAILKNWDVIAFACAPTDAEEPQSMDDMLAEMGWRRV